MTNKLPGDDPREVASSIDAEVGDAADQADRLSRIMEAEAIREGLRGGSGGEGSLDGMDYPLEDLYDVAAMEDSDDASDDPFHAGGLDPKPWMPAEQAAMHVVDADDDYLGLEDGGPSRRDDDDDDGDRGDVER
jgi:hypothetical protein